MEAEHPYAQAAKQLNQLIRQGHSFSGHERNCLFLNVPEASFANVAAVSGWNVDDDARAVARCDWDGDGDLDFWVANRTAPQVRFMRNEVSSGGNSLALKLVGTHSNRDAIGAHVEIVTDRGRRLSKSVLAGEGFLSQSAKRVHFGLGKEQVSAVAVRWPNGNSETFATPQRSATLYRLVEGSGTCEPLSLEPTPVSPVDGPHNSRNESLTNPATAHVLGLPLPLPPLPFKRTTGTISSASVDGRSRLLNLWSDQCEPCLEELVNWTDNASLLRELSLDVTVLSVEQGDGPGKFLKSIDFPFQHGVANGETLELLQLIHNVVYPDDHRPLPVPTSFLINPNGHLVAIYKGPVSVDRIRQDTHAFTVPPEKLESRTLPFTGRWLGRPGPHALSKFNGRLWDHGFEEIAIRFAEGLPNTTYRSEKAKLLLANSIRLRADAKSDQAARQLALHLELEPNSPAGLLELGTNLAKNGDLAAAVNPLQKAVQGFDPPNAKAHSNLGAALRRLNRPEAASEQLTKAIAIEPRLATAHSSLGLLLAGQRKFADAAKSFSVAMQIDPSDASHRLNYAAALLRLARFDEALTQLDQAIENDPSSVTARSYRSEVYVHLGNLDAARSDLTVATTAQPKNPKLWNRLGEVCERQGDMKEAVQSFQQSLLQNPDQPPIATRTAWILATHPDESLRNGAAAVALSQQAAIATDRKVPPVLDVLAAAYAETGQFDKAISTVGEALTLLRDSNAAQSTLFHQMDQRQNGYRKRIKYRNTGPSHD